MLQINAESGMKTSSSTDSVPSINGRIINSLSFFTILFCVVYRDDEFLPLIGSINLLNLSSNNSSTLSLNNGSSPAPPIPPRSSLSSNNG